MQLSLSFLSKDEPTGREINNLLIGGEGGISQGKGVAPLGEGEGKF